MSDEIEIVIGHRFGVVDWFSCCCDFGLCPTVPDFVSESQILKDYSDFTDSRRRAEDLQPLRSVFFRVMPDEIEIVIGHGFGVVGWFSCGCDFGLCPIVPD